MERGYLIATLALTLTFAGLSRGFRSAEQFAFLHFQHFGSTSKSRCPASAAAELAAKMKARLHPRNAEEAQVIAESIPIASIQSSIEEQIARQQQAIRRCAREKAFREAEKANREMQWRMEQAQRVYVQPLHVEAYLPPDFGQRIQERTARMAERLAQRSVQLQMAASRLKLAEREFPQVQRVERPSHGSCRHRADDVPEVPPAPEAESD